MMLIWQIINHPEMLHHTTSSSAPFWNIYLEHFETKHWQVNTRPSISMFEQKLAIIHWTEKPNRCNQCDHASSQASTLRRHLKRDIFVHHVIKKLLLEQTKGVFIRSKAAQNQCMFNFWSNNKIYVLRSLAIVCLRWHTLWHE